MQALRRCSPFCHAVLYAIVGTFFHASAVVTNDGAKPCSFARPKNSQENPGSSCATELAVKSCLQILRRHRRSLLPGLEHAHRSSVKNHVHRPSPIGQPQVTQSEDWYKNKRPPVPELDTTTRLPLQHELMSEGRVRIGLSIRIGSVSV